MKNRSYVATTKLIAALLAALTLSACGTKYADPGESRPRVARSEVPPPTEPTRPTIAPTATVAPEQAVQSLPAAVSLRDQAAIATSANDHARAIGLLERALRISSDDPQTFYDLAFNHLAMQQPQQALQLARRGLSLNPTNAQRQKLQSLVDRSAAML